MVLNPASPLPLYHQLAELLLAQISQGSLKPGARLPSEPELARVHGIGRPTVRQATDVLVQRGLLERRRGSGTYVREAPRRVDLFSLEGTLQSFERGGFALETALVKRPFHETVADDPENPFFGRSAFSVIRVGRVSGSAVLFEHLFLDPDVFPGLLQKKLSGVSLARIVEEQYYLRPTHADQSFRVVLPPLAVRTSLETGPRHAVLLVRRTLHFPKAKAAIYSVLYCRTERLAFSQTIFEDPRHA